MEKTAEREARKTFETEVKNQKLLIAKEKLPGQKLGVGNGMMFTTLKTSPLDEKQTSGIITGQTRMYLMAWATWKDSKNQSGDLDTCQWMQALPSPDLSKEKVVWHLCMWAP